MAKSRGNAKPAQYRCRASFSILRGKDGEGSYTLPMGSVIQADEMERLIAEGILRPEHVEAIEAGETFEPPGESETE